MIQFLEHSHKSAFEDIELTKLSDNSIQMRTIGCTAQKAAKKRGMGYYNCGREKPDATQRIFWPHRFDGAGGQDIYAAD